MKPCPVCNEPQGGRYEHDGLELCWPCWMQRTGLGPLQPSAPVDPPWVTFRKSILGSLWAIDKTRFIYMDANTVLGPCPLCIDGTVRVDFKGSTPRADITCSLGCDEQEIGHALIGRSAAR